MGRLRLLSIFLSVFILTGAITYADETELPVVKVTAGRVEQELEELPLSVTVIDSKQLQRNPKATVTDYLSEIAGVGVDDGWMAGASRISIRGEGSSRVLIAIDGVKLSEQKSMSGAAILIDPSDILRIEVIKGPASVLYGSEAIGGVVNIITKNGASKPLGLGLSLLTDSATASLDGRVNVSGRYKNFFYRAVVSGMKANDRLTPVGKIKNSSYNRFYGSLLAGYEWNKGRFYIKAARYESKINVPRTVEPPIVLNMDLPKWNRDTLSASFETSGLSANLVKLSFKPYYQIVEKDFNNYMEVMPRGTVLHTIDISTLNKQYSTGGSLQSEWLFLNSHYFIAGVDYNIDSLKADSSSIAKVARTGQKFQEDISYSAKLQTTGIFIHDKWDITPSLIFSVGLRETFVDSELKESNDKFAPTGKKSDSNLVGSAGLVYIINPFTLRANFSQGYRFPDINQLYIGTAHGDRFPTKPNKNLKPEKSNNYEAGLRYKDANWLLDGAVYYVDSKDYITTKLNFAERYHIYTNYDKAKTYGTEAYLSYSFKSGFKPYANISYIDRTVWLNGESTKYAGVSPFSGKIGIDWEKEYKENLLFYANLNMSWASGAKLKNEDKLETFHSWEVINTLIGLKGGNESEYNITLCINNIFNRLYKKANNGLIEPGTSFTMSAGYNF